MCIILHCGKKSLHSGKRITHFVAFRVMFELPLGAQVCLPDHPKEQ
jgi:hypothetical protein